MRRTHADEEPHNLDVARGKAECVAHPLEFLDGGAASEAVFERVHRAARLARFGLGPGRPPPRLPTMDEGRLPRTAFCGPPVRAAPRFTASTFFLATP